MIIIGAVGYLNALPLVHDLDQRADIRLVRKVPAGLLAHLETGQLDIALCPVIDAQTSSRDLVVVPSGAIGSRSRALTVRVFSRLPLTQIRRLHVDSDSHTSIALAQVIFNHRFHRIPEIIPLEGAKALADRAEIDAALLIGDKVVTAEPNSAIFPYQMDLGQAWRDMTGLPFVFATWLAPPETDLGSLPQILKEIRRDNCANLETLVGSWASNHGWPEDAALIYLRDLLDYEIGEQQLQAIRLFWKKCADLGLISRLKEIDALEI